MTKAKKKSIYVNELTKQVTDKPLTKEEYAELKQIDQEMVLLKFNVSDAAFNKKQAENKLNETINELTEKQNFFMQRVREIARDHDIEPGSKENGNWSLNMINGKFTRE